MRTRHVAHIGLIVLLACSAQPQAPAPALPPEQPSSGPGGNAYPHEAVATTRLGSGVEEVYLFQPAEPTPPIAPVVVLGHGWAGTNPNTYGAWIEHIVRRGFIVVFPRYQADLRTPVRDFSASALRATQRALDELRSSGHVMPDERGLAFVGHSMGGLVVANLAVSAARGQLPPPLALMSVEPGKTWPDGSPIAFQLDDLSLLPREPRGRPAFPRHRRGNAHRPPRDPDARAAGAAPRDSARAPEPPPRAPRRAASTRLRHP